MLAKNKNKNINKLQKRFLSACFCFFVFTTVIFSTKVAIAGVGINKQINFQGKVVNTAGINVTNDSYTFLFCIYNTASPATTCTTGANNDAIWRESKSITVTDGIFQTNLGDTNTTLGSLDFNNDQIFLGVNFNSNGQMTPLVQFTASPYAMNADNLDGKDWTAPGTIGSLTPNTAAFTTLNSSGNTQLASTVGSTLNLGNATGAGTINSGGTSAWTNTAGNLTISTATSGTLALTSAGALNFSAGAASNVTLANIVNAWNYDSNTLSIDALNNRIGVGTSTPSAYLDIRASDTGAASLQINAGTAPTSPNDGDLWYDGSNLYFRNNTTNKNLLASGGADNLGNHIMTQNLQTGSYWISGDGGNEGLFVDGSGNIGIGTSSPSASLAIADNSSAPTVYANDTGGGNLIQLQKSGVDKFVVANNGGTTINGSDSSIVKQTAADFLATGSTIGTSLDNSNGALSIADTATGGIPNGGNGTITTGGQTTSAAIGAGAFSITRADGKYLVVRGGGNGLDVFDSVANTFTAAPTGQVLNSAAGAGAVALPRPGGRYRVLHGGGVASTSLIDPMLVAPVGANIVSNGNKGAGTVTYLRPNGRFLITNTAAVTTDLYDPVADTFTAGPSGSGGNWVAGTIILPRTDGQALVVVGNSSNTQLYDPNAGAVTGGSPIGAFTVGPAIDGNQTAGTCAINANGSVAFRRQDGKYVILSKVTTWAVYDPVANTMICNASGGPATAIGDGGHAIPLQNGKFLVIVGGGSQKAYIYNPTDNSFTDYGGTPLTAVTTGAHSIMRHDGKWQIIVGGGQATNVYDTALPMSDTNTKYTSEDIYNTSINPNATFWWRAQMESVYAAARNATTNTAYSTIQFFVQTAHSSDSTKAGCATPLNAATLNEIRNSGDLIDASTDSNCIRLTAQFNRPLPKKLYDERNVWVGNGMASTRYNYVTPRLYSIKIDNSAVLRRSNFDFTQPNSNNPTNGAIPVPLTSTLNATGGACTSGTHTWYVTFVTNGVESQLGTPSTPAINCNADGNDSVSLSAIPVGPSGTSARKIYRTPAGNSPDPLLLYTIGDNFTTTYTDISADTSLGAPYALVDSSGPVSTRSETKVETVNGSLVLPYGRIQPTMQNGTSGYYMGAYSNAHPQLTNAAGAGTTVIVRDDKQFLIIEPGGNFADLYDPATETFINQSGAGNVPTTTNAAGVGTGAFSLKRPDGTFLVYLGNLATTTSCTTASTATDIYNPNAPSGSRFVNGPCLTAATGAGVGALAILNNDGTYTIVHGNGIQTTSIYNPITNTMIIGPGTTQNISCGSWAIPMALPNNNQYKIKIGAAPGAAANGTTLNYDANSKVFSAGTAFTTNVTGCGSLAFQRQDGYWIVTGGESSAAQQLTTSLINPQTGMQTVGTPMVTNGTGRGSFVIPRADGTFLVVLGNFAAAGTLNNTQIYYPTGGAAANIMGVPAGTWSATPFGPAFGPSAAAAAPTGALAVSTNLGIGNYYYRYTNVINGIESLPSTVSAVVTTTSGNQAVTLTLAVAPTGTTTRRVYRTVVGGTATSIEYFVGQVDGTGTSFSDTIADATIVANPAIPYAIAPATAATISSIGANGSVDIGVHTYKYTFLTNGVESLPAAVSATATTSAGNQTVNVAGIIGGPTGTTERRVYRTIASSTGLIGSYRLVGIVSGNATPTFTDTYADSTLGSIIPGGAITSAYTGPSDGAVSFQRPDGKWVAINGGSTPSNLVGIYDAGWYSEGQYLSEMMQVPTLVANSTLEWQKTADPYARFEARTATSQAALQTAAFKGVDSPGNSINNSGGETWAQVAINFRRDFPTFCGNQTGVYNSGAGMTFCNRTISLPTVTQYQITNGQDLLSLQTNSYNVLRVTSNGGIYSSQQGGFFAGGADLAENYTSTQTLEKGEVVKIDPNNTQGVVRSQMPYEKDILGVVSTEPGLVTGAYTKDGYPIALIGRVPVKISTENGMVKAGDTLTSSTISGYAMKASVSGRVIGKALEDLDPETLTDCPDTSYVNIANRKCGTLMMFVNLTDFSGVSVKNLIDEATGKGMTIDAGDALPTVLQNQLPDSSGVTPAISADVIEAGKILDFLNKSKENSDRDKLELNSEMFAGKITASGQIVSPLIVTDTLIAKHIKADSIEGLEFIQTSVENASTDAQLATTQTANLGKEVADLKTQLLAMSAPKTNETASGIFKDLEVQGGLKVVVPVEFQGPAIFKAIAEFVDKVVFQNAVDFQGQVTFNSDTAGYAVIGKNQKSVAVVFENEYATSPIVNTSLSIQNIKDNELRNATEDLILNSDVKYLISNVTTKGFEIKINSANDWDIPFAWQAVAVKDVKTSTNEASAYSASSAESSSRAAAPAVPVPTQGSSTRVSTEATVSKQAPAVPDATVPANAITATNEPIISPTIAAPVPTNSEATKNINN